MQLWRHELVLARDVETHQQFGSELLTETHRDLCSMPLLHRDDQIRPFDELGGQQVLRVVVGPGRRAFDCEMAREKLFFGRAAKLFWLQTKGGEASITRRFKASQSRPWLAPVSLRQTVSLEAVRLAFGRLPTGTAEDR